MEDYLPFFVGRQPFLFKIKGGPKLPNFAVTDDDLTRLAEAYTGTRRHQRGYLAKVQALQTTLGHHGMRYHS